LAGAVGESSRPWAEFNQVGVNHPNLVEAEDDEGKASLTFHVESLDGRLGFPHVEDGQGQHDEDEDEPASQPHPDPLCVLPSGSEEEGKGQDDEDHANDDIEDDIPSGAVVNQGPRAEVQIGGSPNQVNDGENEGPNPGGDAAAGVQHLVALSGLRHCGGLSAMAEETHD